MTFRIYTSVVYLSQQHKHFNQTEKFKTAYKLLQVNFKTTVSIQLTFYYEMVTYSLKILLLYEWLHNN